MSEKVEQPPEPMPEDDGALGGILDAVGKAEVELAYLLRAAVEQTGGTL